MNKYLLIMLLLLCCFYRCIWCCMVVSPSRWIWLWEIINCEPSHSKSTCYWRHYNLFAIEQFTNVMFNYPFLRYDKWYNLLIRCLLLDSIGHIYNYNENYFKQKHELISLIILIMIWNVIFISLRNKNYYLWIKDLVLWRNN